MKRTVIIFFLMTIASHLSAQDKNFNQLMSDGIRGMKLQEVQQKLDAFYRNSYKGKGSGWTAYQRWLHTMKTHTANNGEFINFAAMNWQAAKQQVKEALLPEATIGGSWYPLSMLSVSTGKSGRVNCIAFHPTNSNIVFAGTPAGGLWKTTDNGLNWNCISKSIAFLGVSGIAVHPTNADIIYILTGDADGGQLPCIGVLKTTDGGVSWNETGLQFPPDSLRQGYEIKMATDDPELLLVAASNGIYKTTNGGINWVQTLFNTVVFDVEFCPNDSDTCYAAGIRQSTGTGELYRSTFAGGGWALIPSGSYSPSQPVNITRIELAVTPNNSNYVYSIFGSAATGFSGVYVSTDHGSNYSMRSNTPNILGYMANGGSTGTANQVGYDLALTVSPLDTNIVFAAGINVWKSSDGGRNWGAGAVGAYSGSGSQYVHEDIHALEAANSNDVWVGSDGGIFKTVNGGTAWSFPAANLNALQFYDIDGTVSNNNLFFGGTQDNGSIKYDNGIYTTVECCDAGETMVNYSNNNIVYANASNAYLYRSTTGYSPPVGGTDITPWVGCNCADTAGAFILEALALNPIYPNIVYAVYRDCYRSNDGGNNWSRYVTGGNAVHNTISISPSNSAFIYISDGTAIRKSLDSGFSWVPINVPDTVQGRITEVRVDPSDENKIWVSCAGYLNGAKVYEAVKDVGAGNVFTWTNRSAGLPNVPVQCLSVQYSPLPAVYAGTDIGVFLYTSTNGWTPFMNGLPNVRVEDIYLDQTNGYITAATFGMGLWQSSSYGGCVSFIDHSFSIPIYGNEYFEAADSILSQRQITGGAGTGVTYNAGNYVRMGPGFEVKAGSEAHAYIEGCSIGSRTGNKKARKTKKTGNKNKSK
ncbi:MAG TPA: hypothetical protein VN451_11200 [Chitinophagaceae bacterium]|nr:hypothetical protein [Chitinophagaceae bacterium]